MSVLKRMCNSRTKPSDDDQSDTAYVVKKLLQTRLFDDEASGAMWKKSVKDIDGEVLCGQS